MEWVPLLVKFWTPFKATVDDKLENVTREEAIQSVVKAAEAAAASNGADPDTLQLLSQSDVPLAYLPGSNLAISVTVVGELNMKGA